MMTDFWGSFLTYPLNNRFFIFFGDYSLITDFYHLMSDFWGIVLDLPPSLKSDVIYGHCWRKNLVWVFTYLIMAVPGI